MRNNKGTAFIRYGMLCISVTLLIAGALFSLVSCSGGVDVAEADSILTSFRIEWPQNFDCTCLSAEAIEVMISALDQNGDLLNWSGTVTIEPTNANIAVNPDTVNLSNGVVQRNISFVCATSEDEETRITLSYENVLTTFDEIILVMIPSETYTLTVTDDGNGTTDPSGDIEVSNDVPTSISAEPDEGYGFVEWSVESGTGASFGDRSAAETTVSLSSGDATIQANFSSETYMLTITDDGNGSTDPSGSVEVVYGVPNTISAEPEDGYVFVNWSVESGTGVNFDGPNGPNDADTTVTLTDGDATIQANFSPETFVLTITNDGDGTTDPTGSIEVVYGVATAIYADPNIGFGFVEWSVESGTGVNFGGPNGPNDADTTITLTDGDAIIRANFSSETFILTITDDGNGSTDPTGSFEVIYGVQTDISADPDTGYLFESWSVESGTGVIFGGINDPETTAKLTDGDANIQANFKIPPAGSISINNDEGYTNSIDTVLTISAEEGSGVDLMMISNDSGFTGASWETFAESRNWQIESGDDSHIVYIKFKDYLDYESIVYNDTIILDTVDPSISVSNLVNNGVVESGFVIGTAGDENGLSDVEFKLDGGVYTDVNGTEYWYFQLPTGSSTWRGGTEHTIDVRSTDAAGNYTEINIAVYKGRNKDVNGDGYADLAVGAYMYNSYQGRAYIFEGGSEGISNKNLSDPDFDTADTTLTGQASSWFGFSVALGDVNGDGYADLAVGAPHDLTQRGRAYVFEGGSDGISSKNLGDPDFDTADTTLTGEYGTFGRCMAIGDVNGDGYADLAVGADSYNSYQGRAYVFVGGSDGIPNKNLEAPDYETADTTLTGEASSYYGYSVALGDIDGDGYADLAVGAERYNTGQGRAYVFVGGSDGISDKNLDAPDYDTADTTITGEYGDSGNSDFGNSVALGDINGDGYADLAVGANRYNSGDGRAYVFKGGSGGISDKNLDVPDYDLADTTLTGEHGDFGYYVAIGDVDGDGYADLAVGSYHYSGQGRAYIFEGGSEGILDKNLDAPDYDLADTTLTGEDDSDFGFPVAFGDVDGDGYADLTVGAYRGYGRAHIFKGGWEGISDKNLDDPDYDTADTTLTGEASSYFGFSLDG